MPATPPADQLFLALQSALAGEYSLERELGRGGMGVVYLAREVRLAREVAIKVLPPTLAASGELSRRFLAEAQTAARLSHPNIVPIYRVDEAQGFVYIAMGFVPGMTLAQHIAQHGPMTPHRAARVLRDVAWALAHAHASGIVHRDVKADNILLETGTDRALVSDFGLANAEHVPGGEIMGSAHYISPEQIGGDAADARSDVYGLGVTGYLTLTGRLPFDAPSSREVLAKHLGTKPPAILTVAPATPARLAHIVERCMARQPQHRFASAAQVAEAIDAASEPSREIPAPVRVWAMREESMGGTARFGRWALTGLGTIGAVAALAAGHPGPLIGFGLLGLAIAAASLTHLRRVLRAGYGLDDLRAGIREHWSRRNEELQYESGLTGSIGKSRIVVPLLVGVLALVALRMVGPFPLAALQKTLVLGFALSTGTSLGLMAVRYSRERLARRGEWYLRFWNGPSAARLVRVASLGLRRSATPSSLHQLTEVALGRATDAIFEALPKHVRKELRELPAIVRRLEGDARRLREQLDQVDTAAASLDYDDSDAPESALTRARQIIPDVNTRRARLTSELTTRRDRVNAQLATTVAALENIRLDLLRLQLGSGQVESVTATLDAARDASLDIGALVEAERLLGRELSPAH